MTASLAARFKSGYPLATLGSVASVRWELATDAQLASGEVKMVEKVSFDGEVFAGGKDSTKMDQWIARPGDLLISKIRARQGSVGLVSETHGPVSCSIHYRSLIPDTTKVDAVFAWLTLRSGYCRAQFLAATGGAMKGEISEERLLSLNIPLPPLATQRAIVAHWQAAQESLAATAQANDAHEAAIRRNFLEALGLPANTAGPTPRVFAARWSDVEAWSGKAVHLGLTRGDMRKGRYPVVKGRDCLVSVQHGCSQGPSTLPTTLEVLKISAATRGEYDRNQRKFIADNPQIRRNFDLRVGDVLMCRTNGTLAYVGMSALVRENEADLIFPDKLIRVRAKETMTPDFLWLVLQTPALRSQIESAARTAVGNYAIGGTDIWNFDFPLPPLAIQRQLVAEVTAARARIAAARAAAAKLAADTAREVEEMILGVRPPPARSR